jgi:hypothetical protein
VYPDPESLGKMTRWSEECCRASYSLACNLKDWEDELGRIAHPTRQVVYAGELGRIARFIDGAYTETSPIYEGFQRQRAFYQSEEQTKLFMSLRFHLTQTTERKSV